MKSMSIFLVFLFGIQCSLSFLTADEVLLQDDFNDNSLDITQWSTFQDSEISETKQQIKLVNHNFLKTVKEFKPNKNLVLKITGTITFSSSNSVMIFTRSDAVPFAWDVQNGISFVFGNLHNNMAIQKLEGGIKTTLVEINDISIQNDDVFRFTITDNGSDLILKIQEIGGEEFSKRITATTATSFTKNHVVFCSHESTNFADNAVILDDVVIANQGNLEQAIEILENIDNDDPTIQRNIDRAIESIEKSLFFKGVPIFLDNERISSVTGKNVFKNVKRAASTLVKDINKDTTPQPIKDAFQQVVDLLLLSTKEIAELSLETAQEAVGILEIDARSLGTAVSEFTKGKLEADAAKAINAFGKSWQSSQKAVSKRLRELAILNFNDSPDPFGLETEENILQVSLEIVKLKSGVSHTFHQVIKDTDDNIIRTIVTSEVVFPLSLKVSIQSVWDGKDNNGNSVAPGDYKYIAFSQLTNDKNGRIEQLSFPIIGNITVEGENENDLVFMVTSSNDNTVDILDAKGNVLVDGQPVGNSPGGVAFGDNVFVVSNFDDDTIDILDLGGNILVDGQPVGDGPIGIAFGDGVFMVANTNDGTIDTFDSAGNILVDGQPVGNGPFDIAFGDGVFVVTNQIGGTVDIVDSAGNILVDGQPVGNKPLGVAFGNGVFMVANSDDGTVDIIDSAGNILVDGQPVGNKPEGVAFGNGVFMVVNLADNTVDILDPEGNVLVDGQAVGNQPEDIAFGDGVFMVTSTSDSAVDILNSEGNVLVDGQPVGNNPDDVASSESQSLSTHKKSKQGVYWQSGFRAERTSRIVRLTWKNISSDYIGFNIWKKNGNEKNFLKINGLHITPDATEMNSYEDMSINPTASFFYKVEYIRFDGRSDFTHTTFVKRD